MFAKKEVYASGLIVQAIIWQLPEASVDRPHGLKYRLYCGRRGECVVRYDNETGKGDHVHYGEKERPYRFVTLQRLVNDFYRDIERLTGERP